jgi:hypothetical protein
MSITTCNCLDAGIYANLTAEINIKCRRKSWSRPELANIATWLTATYRTAVIVVDSNHLKDFLRNVQNMTAKKLSAQSYSFSQFCRQAASSKTRGLRVYDYCHNLHPTRLQLQYRRSSISPSDAEHQETIMSSDFNIPNSLLYIRNVKPRTSS